jgi:hypothetical protein
MIKTSICAATYIAVAAQMEKFFRGSLTFGNLYHGATAKTPLPNFMILQKIKCYNFDL